MDVLPLVELVSGKILVRSLTCQLLRRMSCSVSFACFLVLTHTCTHPRVSSQGWSDPAMASSSPGPSVSPLALLTPCAVGGKPPLSTSSAVALAVVIAAAFVVVTGLVCCRRCRKNAEEFSDLDATTEL